MKQRIKHLFLNNKFLNSCYTLFHHNKIHSGILLRSSAVLKNNKIFQIKNCKKNSVLIGFNSHIQNTIIVFHGNDNQITIGDNVSLINATIKIFDDKNIIRIGNNTKMSNAISIYSLEGHSIIIGTDCLFGEKIEIRNSDSHSIINSKGIRLNPANDVVIGNHVWVGRGCLILKGTNIGNNCVVGANSILTKNYNEGSLLVGSPAKCSNQNINWDINRI